MGIVITQHARRRYRQRVSPGADDREATPVLLDAAERMVRCEERTSRGQVVWAVDNPNMWLVTKHDPSAGLVIVTVLSAPDEVDEDEVLAKPPPVSMTWHDRRAAEIAAARQRRREREAQHEVLLATQSLTKRKRLYARAVAASAKNQDDLSRACASAERRLTSATNRMRKVMSESTPKEPRS